MTSILYLMYDSIQRNKFQLRAIIRILQPYAPLNRTLGWDPVRDRLYCG